MNDQKQSDRERQLKLARRIFDEFRVICFWSWQDKPEITENLIPHMIRELRLNGGHRGYRAAIELCR